MSKVTDVEVSAFSECFLLYICFTFQAYIDGGSAHEWVGIGESAVFTDGGVNDINNACKQIT